MCLHEAHSDEHVIAAGSGRSVACVMIPDDELARWATTCGAALLAPSATSYRDLSDKAALAEVLRGADVAVPRAEVVGAHDDARIARWLRDHGGRLVLQRIDDGRSGAGTRLITSVDDYTTAVSAFGDDRYKAAELVSGLPCTVSGYVSGSDVAITTVTQQLVSLGPERFGEHFGNQVLSAAHVGEQAIDRLRTTTHHVGQRLRALGLRGTFGIDAVLADGLVTVIEINPRMQSTTSLGAWQEWRSGLLPGPLAHVLAQVDPDLAFESTDLFPTTLAQAHVRADVAGRIRRSVPDGGYLIADGQAKFASASSAWFLDKADDPDAVWIWSAAPEAGQAVELDQLLAIVHSHRPLFTVSEHPVETPHGERLRQAVHASFR